jgi:hypothetical protein
MLPDRLRDTRALSTLSPANKNAPAFDAMGRFNRDHLDAAGIDGEAVMERDLIKVAVDRAEVREIRSATRQGIQMAASRRLGRATQDSDNCGNHGDLGGMRHILILKIDFRTVIFC